MEYHIIGNSGLKVSRIGLGGNNFGTQFRADEETSLKIIQHALDVGINFIDTAALYGRSEEIIGKALKGKRNQVILATKFGNPQMLQPNELGGSRGYIVKAVDNNLRRLDTDYIDLYYIHYPDVNTPILETLRALDTLVRSGKVRYIGCSSFDAWMVCDAAWTSLTHNLEPFIAAQNKYNLLDRSLEKELRPCCQAHGIGIIPWEPLASGFLTGKYRRGEKIPEGYRLAHPRKTHSYIMTEANFDKLDALTAFARERGHTAGELALAWLLARPWVCSIIAGVTGVEQLDTNLGAMNWHLTQEEVAEIDKISE